MSIQPFKLERFYTIHEFKAKYLLCSSDCEAMSIGDLLALEDYLPHYRCHNLLRMFARVLNK